MRVFPALTPREIRALRVYQWWQVAIATDEWLKQREQSARRGRTKLRGASRG